MNDPITAPFECQCSEAGHCPVYKGSVTPRQHLICQHLVLTPDKCTAYQRMWLLKAPNVPGVRIFPMGVGDHFKKLAAELELFPKQGCNCTELAHKMNIWGPEGCEEHMDEIVPQLEENFKGYNWKEKLNAARLATQSGLVLEINWTSVLPSLVRIAIKRTRKGYEDATRNNNQGNDP